MSPKSSPLVQGTLDMLILKTLALQSMHGYGIGLRVAQVSDGTFQVNAGSLFPALARLERSGAIKGEWKVTENNRRARLYSITPEGRTRLKQQARDWQAQTNAITAILRAKASDA